MKKKESNFQTKKIKPGHGPHRVPDSETNLPTDHPSQYNLTSTCIITLQITDPSSCQRGRLT
jgi:hypothetical protein